MLSKLTWKKPANLAAMTLRRINTPEASLELPPKPYYRANPITESDPLDGSVILTSNVRYAVGHKGQQLVLVLKPQSSDTVYDNGSIEWNLGERQVIKNGCPTSEYMAENTLDFILENNVQLYTVSSEPRHIAVYRSVSSVGYVYLGDYQPTGRHINSPDRSISYWLKPIFEIGLDKETLQFRNTIITRDEFEEMNSPELSCELCGADTELSVNYIDSRSELTIVCQVYGCNEKNKEE